MSNQNYFLEKVEKMLFLEIKKGSKINNYEFKESVYLPVNSEKIVSKAKDGDDLSNIPVNLFIEGMAFVLGADKKFRFNEVYKEIMNSIPGSENYIKGKIFENIKQSKYEDAYIMTKGLLQVDFSKDVLDKAYLLCDALRKNNSNYMEELEELVIIGKDFKDYPKPYYYDAIVNNIKGEYEKALFNVNQYLSLGGEKTEEIEELKNSLDIIDQYDKGKSMVYDDPNGALKILLPLMEVLGDKVEVYYYIAVAYRILQNYEKAIYYLNDALAIDTDYVEVFNEMGINYACINDFEKAIMYFKKVFEVTKSIEVCTNIVMCYLNINDLKNAKLHLEIAKKLNPDDEIVKELQKIIEK